MATTISVIVPLRNEEAHRRNGLCEGIDPLGIDRPALQALLQREPLPWSPFPMGSLGFPFHCKEETEHYPMNQQDLEAWRSYARSSS